MINETLDKMWNILKENQFKIDLNIYSDILCTSCKSVMIQPRIVPCGCRYCYDCLLSYLNGDLKLCSGESHYCKSELINIDKNVYIDQPANIKISRIVVKCPLESCEFNTELGKMADHMRTCDRQPVACPYYAIGCGDNKICDDKMKLHFKQENYCHARLLMEFLENLKNEVKLLKSKILDLNEENKWIREQMESKQEKNVGKLLEENRSLKELETDQEQMRAEIEGINRENNSLREELEIIKLDNKGKEEKISALEASSKENEQELSKFKDKCEFLEKNREQVKTDIDTISLGNAIMAKEFKERENEMKILETKLTQVQANQNFEFVWYIENWDAKKNQAEMGIKTKIYSEPFFSHKNGYKMCLRLDPDGNGSRKGTHLALYICIMRGEFDNSLEWPFRHEIQLELMNQETELAHVRKIVYSKKYQTSISWKKPDKESNVGNGHTDFMELSELASNAALCRGNQIVIKAIPQMNP